MASRQVGASALALALLLAASAAQGQSGPAAGESGATGRAPCESGDPMPIVRLDPVTGDVADMPPVVTPLPGAGATPVPIPNLCPVPVPARATSGVVPIRGGQSLARPLYVVDGVVLGRRSAAENPVEALTPGDIVSITVIKTNDAVARYGPEAAQGVVIVTTRRGADETPRP